MTVSSLLRDAVSIARTSGKVNESVGCIELRNDSVAQAKAPHNQLLRNQECEFVENWIKAKGLSIGTNDLRLS